MSTDDSRGETGKTGRTGETGQRGYQGQQGNQGVTGSGGIRGERGQQGDHGQTGGEGPRGVGGAQGYPGQPGAQGVRGAQGLNSPGFARRLLALFVAMMLVFGFLAFRSQKNTDDIAHNLHLQLHAQYSNCQTRNANIRRLNRLYDTLARIEETNPFRATAPTTVRRRIALYHSAHLAPLDCGPRP